MIVFAQHNVFQDPPFGKLDLISCRNLLIYFQTVLQRNLFAIFHMALNDRGYLFLGRSESVINYDDVFRTVCANEKIFVHNASGKAPTHDRINYAMQAVDMPILPIHTPRQETQSIKYSPNELDTAIFESLMPATLLVDENNELTRTYGDCSKLISMPTGAVTLDVFALIRNDLKIPVSTVLKESREKQERVGYVKIPVHLEDTPEYISILAEPVKDKTGVYTGHTALSFVRGNTPIEGTMQEYQIDTAAARRIANLEHDLKVTQDNLRQTVSELESVNAELQAANEELLTANEELQSSNEELQSVNEELYTVNSEYQSR
jgi:two-component system CheB/CheR fusion protein